MKKIIIAAVTFLITFILVLTGMRPEQYDITAGHASPADIYAKREVVDTVTTEKRRAEAEADLQDKYEISPDLSQEAQEALSDFLSFVGAKRAEDPALRETEKDGVDISYLLDISEDTFSSFCDILTKMQNTLLESGVLQTDEAIQRAETDLSAQLSDEAVSCAVAILNDTLRANKIYSSEKTEEARQNLRDSIEDVTYKANQIIVRRGDIVTQAQYEVLKSLGMVKSDNTRVHILAVCGAFLLLLTCFTILYLFMRKYADVCLRNNGLLCMAAIIFTLNILLCWAGSAMGLNPYLLPIIAGTALLAILLDIRFAITYNTVVSLLYVLVFGGDTYCLACLLLSGTLSAFIFTRPGLRHTLVFSALMQALFQLLLYFSIGALEGLDLRHALLRGLFGFAAGGITSVLLIGTLPFWEYAFDVTTPYKLLELSNPDQPLLKRLVTEAPGTYHHSLMVGNLAEAACEAIGGNALLARTGAYYHDVGKLRQPQYFKENQYTENPHDKMSPVLSATVIINHVKEGVELARQYRLPSAIRGIIASHHGNSIVSFFYHKAQIENSGEVDAEKFRYPGPRPQTQEEAIVMLADSAEAAVRSLESKDEGSIREMVHKILQGKLQDGQMGKSGLTLRDIETIEASFIHVFFGYFHNRIKYPDAEKPKENA